MSAPSGSAPVSPFLAFVTPEDRSPLRVGLWLALGLPLAFIGFFLVGAGASAVDPSLLTGAARGGRSLLQDCRELGLEAFLELGMALPILAAARIAFQRPAWTFVSPSRPFAPALLGVGAAAFALITAVLALVKMLEGGRLAPPLLDASLPVRDRIVYVLASAPLVLLSEAAQELVLRGVVLQVCGAFVRTRVGLCVLNGLVSGLMFAVFFQQPNPFAFLELAATGAAFAYAVLELGGLEFTVGAAFAGDFVSLMLERLQPAARAAAFRWTDLATPAAWFEFANITLTVLLTLAAVRVIKRLRKA